MLNTSENTERNDDKYSVKQRTTVILHEDFRDAHILTSTKDMTCETCHC